MHSHKTLPQYHLYRASIKALILHMFTQCFAAHHGPKEVDVVPF